MTHAHLNFYNYIDGKKYYVCSIHICHDGFDDVVIPILRKAFNFCEKIGHIIEIKGKDFSNWFSAETLAFNFCAFWGKDDGVMLFNEEESDASYFYEIINNSEKRQVEIILNGYKQFSKVWERTKDNNNS